MMDRQNFIKKAGLGLGVTAATIAPLSAASRKRFRWRMVMVVPKTLPIWGPGMLRFAERVKLMSGGSLSIKVYGAGELVPALETFETVKKGNVEMGHSAAYYWRGKIPASVFFTSVPFGMNANGMNAWLTAGGGQELWDELYGSYGLKAIPCGNTGVQMGGWFKKEINKISDFKGLKMRMPGLGGAVIAKAGAIPQQIPGGEILTNLQTGVIDATEWVGPYHDYIMGFPKAAKYYYSGGWHEPGSVLELMINKDKWESLGKELQMIVKSCAALTNQEMYGEWLAKDSEYYKKILSEGKTEMREYPLEITAKMHQYSNEILAGVAKTSPLAKKIYDSFKKFQSTYEKYQEVSEQAYVRAQKA
jgi:TRAP-type mannitol/chloroaromatic compound transport system substrate-binding protein